MRTINFSGKVGRAIFAFSLMLGIGFMMSITAQAQGRNNDEWQRRERDRQIWQDRNRDQDRARRDDRYGNNGGYGNQALNQGYQAGIQIGASDAQRGQSYSPQRSRYYRDASSQPFRNGFVRGYDAGFRQYGGYNNGGYNNGTYNNDGYNNGTYNNGGYNNGTYNNGGYNNGNQTALNQGYQVGIQTGASDAQRGQSYSPQRSHYYRDAGSQAFRNGFVQGYDAGFRQYGGYNNGGYQRGNTRGGLGSILGGIFQP